jgi:exosome complex component RRP42
MAKPTAQSFLLSPAELSFLHESLSLVPAVRPDGRTPTQFRPLIAETGILPSANGSARVCFADGTEAIVGVKAEVEKSHLRPGAGEQLWSGGGDNAEDEGQHEGIGSSKGVGESLWVEMSIEVPGYRDDDALPVFLSTMLTEALVADCRLKDRLWINRRFHWKLYIDVRAAYMCNILHLHSWLTSTRYYCSQLR